MVNYNDNVSDEIKQRLDIVDLIQEYILLKKAGVNFKAVCPFHHETKPSFIVSPEKQIWHCFGCEKGGDIFTFVMEMEGMEFADALKFLAKKAGIILKRHDPVLQTKRTRILEILDLAAEFYRQALLKSKSGQLARDYLVKRKINKKTEEDFRLGFAPSTKVAGWETINKFLVKKGYRPEEICAAGLTAKKEGSNNYYDRFRNRLIFPINDVHGNVVGFSGRILDEAEETGKYINTPTTLVYDKSRVLYGLDKAKTEIRKKDFVVIVEGQMDVIASHQIGVKNVIASSGTALTEGQIELLKRYTKSAVLAFDVDLAGDSATKRGIDLAVALGLEVKIAQIPLGKDPDECIRSTGGLAVWKKTIKGAQTIMNFYFKSAFKNADMTNVADKKRIADILLPVIKKIPNKIEQAHYIQKLASQLKTDEEILIEELENIKLESSEAAFYRRKKGEIMKKESSIKGREQIVAERLIGLVFKFPEYINYLMENSKLEYFPQELLSLYKNLKNYYNKKKAEFNSEGFLRQLKKKEPKLKEKIDIFVLAVENEFSEISEDSVKEEMEKEIKLCLKRLYIYYLQNQLKFIESKIKREEKKGDKKEITKLTEQFDQISKEFKKVTSI